AALPMQMPFRFRKKTRKQPLMQQPVSDAVLVLLHVKMARQCYLFLLKLPTLQDSRRAELKEKEELWQWSLKWMKKVLVPAQTPKPAQPNAQKKFQWMS